MANPALGYIAASIEPLWATFGLFGRAPGMDTRVRGDSALHRADAPPSYAEAMSQQQQQQYDRPPAPQQHYASHTATSQGFGRYLLSHSRRLSSKPPAQLQPEPEPAAGNACPGSSAQAQPSAPPTYHPRVIFPAHSPTMSPLPCGVGCPFPYRCRRCGHSGHKSNRRPCGSCQTLFGRQGIPVQYVSPHNVPTIAATVPAGDPRLGGALCQACRGRGFVDGFFFINQCERCRGVGRLL